VRNDSARTRACGEPRAFLNERDLGGEWGEGWNSRTRYSSVSTAALTLFLLQANSCSSTISSSRTNPSVAKSVRQSEFPCWALHRPVRFQTRLKPEPHALNAARKPPSPSNPHRGGRFFVVNAFSSGDNKPRRRDGANFVTARMAGISGRSG
jgi:hypothetical protein